MKSICLACVLVPALLSDAGAQVPQDLSKLLTPAPSRMQLIARRYEADRSQLDRFFRTPLSNAHLARLLRFDSDWLAAVAELDETDFNKTEKRDAQDLRAAIRKNVGEVERSAARFARMRPLLPFAHTLEAVLDARRKVLPMDAEPTAATIAAVADRIRALQAGLATGRLAVPSEATGLAAATAADELRAAIKTWFGFYNGYDPLFTWWLAKPYERFDAAIADYAKLLRENSKGIASGPAEAGNVKLEPAPAPEHPYVPDLAQLLAYPHNEMLGVWNAYRGEGRGQRRAGGRRGARGRRGGRRGRRAPRTEKFCKDWLTALGTLDFDALSRPAQVTYLAMRNDLEVGLRRLSTPAQQNIPSIPDDSGIKGRPIGRTELQLRLAEELIPYSPEELIAIGDAEYAWCMEEMLKASRDLGYGDKWRDALEHVKKLHVRPGGQPVVIRKLMHEAVDFLREHDMVTVPEVAAETLTLGMMSPERQLVNPFFTGGTRISVSFPTDTMTHEAKLQSLRGNNIPFSRATVHHELIPGHNLQFFIDRRFGSTRATRGRTPFHLEGWAVYFEMLLYRMGYPRIMAERSGGPNAAENRIGFLFWRMHRSARITFSLRFHLGLWSAQQCIDFLVDGVGHERKNATAEVRRSFAGSYSPLYQAGYLLGAVQLRTLHKELVESGKWKERDLHDTIIRAGPMPIALVRLLVDGEKLTRDMPLAWKFYGDPIPSEKR